MQNETSTQTGGLRPRRRHESPEDKAARAAREQARADAETKVFTDSLGNDVDPMVMETAKQLGNQALTPDLAGRFALADDTDWADIVAPVAAAGKGQAYTDARRAARAAAWVRAYTILSR
jgi:hypothetical protein